MAGVPEHAERSPWLLVAPSRSELRLRLFCLPYAGGGAAVYRLWPQAVPEGVEVCRLQLPGREDRLRERPFQRLDQLVAALLEVLEPRLDVPFAIFGHSMGAVVGFALARAMRQELDRLPAHLFVSGRRAPHGDPEPELHRLPEESLVREVRRRYGGISDAVLREPELMAIMLPLIRADLAVCESADFTEEAPLGCPISAYGGVADSWVRREHLAGWGRQTTDRFEVRIFEGDHFFLDSNRSAVLRAVCETLGRSLDGSEEGA